MSLKTLKHELDLLLFGSKCSDKTITRFWKQLCGVKIYSDVVVDVDVESYTCQFSAKKTTRKNAQKKQTTWKGVEPATLRFVACCSNHSAASIFET